MTADRVILLTADALAANHVGWLGYQRDTTPHLDKYAQKGVNFENCISQSSHTRESMLSMFLSIYPFEAGGVGPINKNNKTLATTLSNAGIQTAGFHSNPYLSRAYNFDRGFDTFSDSLNLGGNRFTTFVNRIVNHFSKEPYTRASKINDKGLSWLSKTDTEDQQFLWLHYMDAHGPYQPPDKHQKKFSNSLIGKRDAKKIWRKTVDSPEMVSQTECQQLINLYDAEISYLDEKINQFIESLKSNGLFSDTVVIIASDHGELFGEHDLYGHPRYLHNELVHVPLLMLGEGISSDSVRSPVENLDIAPTVIDLFGLNEVADFHGSSLFNTGENIHKLSAAEASGEKDDTGTKRVAVRSETHHYCVESRDGDIYSQTMYKIGNGTSKPVDTETVDEEELVRLVSRAKKQLNYKNQSSSQQASNTADSTVEERLKDLGYK